MDGATERHAAGRLICAPLKTIAPVAMDTSSPTVQPTR
jgi:hypothetical protein